MEASLIRIIAVVGLAVGWAGCAGRAEPDPESESPDGGIVAGGTAVVVGCKEEPLVLGAVSDVESASPQVAWMRDAFAIGWATGGGYRIRVSNGHSISNSVDLANTPASAQLAPQLFWAGSQLQLYYSLSDAFFVDTFDSALNRTDTRMIGYGRGRAVQLDAERIALLTDSALYLDGVEQARSYAGVRAAGWNGQSFLVSDVLGHGEWSLYGVGRDGMRIDPAIDLNWCGVCNATGPAAGSSFASSESAQRHAVTVAANRKLQIAIEGQPAIARELVAESADAAMFWDGERYLVLLADHTQSGAMLGRDLELLSVSAAGTVESEKAPLMVSEHVAEERFPAGAAAKPGHYGIAWVRGSELVFQHCVLSARHGAQ